MTWNVSFFSRRLEGEILALPAGFVARFLRYAERMELSGPDLGMPHTRAMRQGLFEPRLKAAEGVARILYCTIVDRQHVAERVGTTQSAIARLESGALKHSPSIATLQKYAKALGYRVEVKFVKERGLTSASTRTRRERGSRLAG